MEKDLVIVAQKKRASRGTVISSLAQEVDGNWTMKYFRKKEETVTPKRLEAAKNPGMSLIVPQTELRD